jgi:lysophosphatidate acyltransferase
MLSVIFSVLKPIAYISLPVIIINSVASTSPKTQYYVRSATYAGTMAVVGACSVFAAAGMALVGEKYNVNYVVARAFYWTASKIMNIDVEVEGEEHLLTQPAMLLSNHQSMLDVLILARWVVWFSPCPSFLICNLSVIPKRTSMTAKRSIQFTPLGPFMTLSGAVFVDRGSNTRAVKSLQEAGQTVKREHISIFMYPEGTRHSSEEPNMLPFKKGPFHLSVQASIPIVPIVAENYWSLYHVGFFGKGTIKVKGL